MLRDKETKPSGSPDRAGNDTRRRRQGKTKPGQNAGQSPSAPIPKDEALRLEALERLALLDTPPEECFDRITRLAARVFDAPIALISLVDERRQWFKSRCGLDAEQTDRSVAFCAHAILGDRVMVVPDATKDDRFSANPLVTGNPDIRFYAGAPLVTAGGSRVGTLCVIDTVARPDLTADQKTVLQDLAAMVVDQFDVRLAAGRVVAEVNRRKKTQHKLEASENRLRTFIEYAPAAIAMFDKNLRYLAASRRYLADFRLEGGDVIGCRYANVFPNMPPHWTDLIERCLSGNVVRCDEDGIERKDGSIEWLRWEGRPWCRANGDIGGIVLFTESITERKRAEDALRASERRYRDLYNKTPVMLHSIDSQGRLISVSDYWLRSMGYTRDEVIGRPVIEFLTEESRRHAIEVALPALMRTGSRTDVEYQFVKKSGEVIDVLLSATSERDAEGTIERALAVSIDVTARKRAEETLRQSERQFRGAFETAPFGMTLVAPDGSYLAVNPAFCELVGYTAEDLLRTGFKSITHPDDLRQDRKYMGEILAGKRRSCQIEKRYIHKQGHIVCVLLSSSLVRDSDGNPVHFVAQTLDLTDRKRAEDALRASEQRYRELYNKTPVMLHSIDSQGRLISVSDYWLRSMGYTREEVIGRSATEFLTEESRRHAIEVVLPALMRNGSRTDVEYQFVKKSGEVIDVLLSATSERDAEGTIERALAVSIDVTARKQAEEALRQSEQQFRGAFETAPHGMTLMAPDGRYLAVNPAFCELVGYSAEDLLQTGFRSITHPDDLHPGRKYMREISDGKRRSCQFEKRYIHRQGYFVCVLLSASLVRNADGEPVHFVAQILDLTESKRAEEAMRDLSARVLHAQEDERRRIARDLHDDIGQRLALLSIDLDGMQLDPPASATELKARLQAQAERSKEISSDIQLLSRQLHPTRLETLGLVAALEGLCREVSEHSDLQVDFAESEVPEKVPDDVALSLYRIAQEALQNAVKHSGARQASVALRASPGAIRLEMTDAGMGFDAGLAGNQGLGLVSMTERARAVGGDISVDAGPSRGTQITVRAPLGAGTDRNGGAGLKPARAQLGPSTARAGRRRRGRSE